MTPEQLAAYFNAGWFGQQIWNGLYRYEDARLALGSKGIDELAAHLAGNLAQAAMALEGEARAREAANG